MTHKACSVEDCTREFFAKGWCRAHYSRNQRYGTPEGSGIALQKVKTTECSVKDCGSSARVHGMCAKHEKRVRLYGDPNTVNPSGVPKTRTVCKYTNCGKPEAAKELCSMHYSRMRRHGDLEAVRSVYSEEERSLARKQAMSKWYAANAEQRREISRQYALKHPEKSRERQHTRRARQRGVFSESFSDADMLEKYGTDCHICNLPIDLEAPRAVGREGWERGLHREHVIALASGGTNTLDNCRPAHGLCNLVKGWT